MPFILRQAVSSLRGASYYFENIKQQYYRTNNEYKGACLPFYMLSVDSWVSRVWNK